MSKTSEMHCCMLHGLCRYLNDNVDLFDYFLSKFK